MHLTDTLIIIFAHSCSCSETYACFNDYFLLTVVHVLNYMHVLIIIFCSQLFMRSTTCMCTIVSMHSDTKTEILDLSGTGLEMNS